MKFFDEEVGEEHIEVGVRLGATGLSMWFVSAVSSWILAHRYGWQWGDTAMVGAAAVGVVYLTSKIRELSRTRNLNSISASPNLVFGIVVLLAGSSLVATTDRGAGNIYLFPLLAVIIFVAIIGDTVMRLSMWAICSIGTSLSLLAQHFRGTSLVVNTLVYAAGYASVISMVAQINSWFIGRYEARDALKKIAEETSSATDLREALRRCAPVICSMFRSEWLTVVEFGEHGNLSVFMSWFPHGNESVQSLGAEPDTELNYLMAEEIKGVGSLPQLLENSEHTHGNVLTREFAIVHFGFTDAGEMMLVAKLSKQSRMRRSLMEDVTDALASILLRVSWRISYFGNLKEEVRQDPLTGLANRRALSERVETEMSRAARFGSKLAVAILDVDYFKAYNDQFGHAEGDQLLRSMAEMMSDRVRGQDLVVRYGGEEFCVLLPDTDPEGAERLINKLRQMTYTVPGRKRVSLSGGVAIWDGSESFDELMKRADDALYVAKKMGRNRVVFAELRED